MGTLQLLPTALAVGGKCASCECSLPDFRERRNAMATVLQQEVGISLAKCQTISVVAQAVKRQLLTLCQFTGLSPAQQSFQTALILWRQSTLGNSPQVGIRERFQVLKFWLVVNGNLFKGRRCG